MTASEQTRPFAWVEPHASFTLTSRHSHERCNDPRRNKREASIMTTLILEEMQQFEGTLITRPRPPAPSSCSARRSDPAFVRSLDAGLPRV
jgi:hypothetical protein